MGLGQSKIKANILIVDDNELFRERLRRFISETSDMVVTDEAGNGNDALEKASKKFFDMVVLDIDMPGMSGLDVLQELKSKNPDLSVLVLSMFPVEHYELSVMKTGGDGYMTKGNMTDELIMAMRQILNGGKYFNFSLPEELGK
jgi:two-component system, NarL family, invasion response regulator UvrY